MGFVILNPTRLREAFPRQDYLDPFDVDEPRTQWFIEARGYSRAWVAPDCFGSPYTEIQMGYRYLRKLEKLAVVVNGKVVGDWPRTDLSLAPYSATLTSFFVYFQVKRHLTADDERKVRALGIPLDDFMTGTGAYDPMHVERPGYMSALELALTLPPDIDEALMVARLLHQTSWH